MPRIVSTGVMWMTLKRQALVLTAGNVLTRGLGFVLRLCLARWMTPGALGVMELSGTVAMLAITPVTAGIPSAVSRLAAQAPAGRRGEVLHAGRSLALRASLLLMPIMLALSPLFAWLLGDARTLPAILAAVPQILLLGLCSVCNGYCYGTGDTLLPAADECLEQTVRLLLCALLLRFCPLPDGLAAAMPGVAGSLAACAALLLFRVKLPRPAAHAPDLPRQLFRLAAPLTATRLLLTGARALNAVLLPFCLRRSGLSAEAAVAQYGLLGGMAMPLIMAPGVITGALCMVATPAISRLEHQPAALRPLMLRMRLAGIAVGAAAGVALFAGSEVISRVLYRQDALAPLLRFMSPLPVLMALHQVHSGIITGLGLQRRALTAHVAASALSLVITSALCLRPDVRIFGAAAAMLVSQGVQCVWETLIIRRRS